MRPGTPNADVDAYVAPVAGVEADSLPIGKVVDSADDTARLMIINQYEGSKTVKVVAFNALKMRLLLWMGPRRFPHHR